MTTSPAPPATPARRSNRLAITSDAPAIDSAIDIRSPAKKKHGSVSADGTISITPDEKLAKLASPRRHKAPSKQSLKEDEKPPEPRPLRQSPRLLNPAPPPQPKVIATKPIKKNKESKPSQTIVKKKPDSRTTSAKPKKGSKGKESKIVTVGAIDTTGGRGRGGRGGRGRGRGRDLTNQPTQQPKSTKKDKPSATKKKEGTKKKEEIEEETKSDIGDGDTDTSVQSSHQPSGESTESEQTVQSDSNTNGSDSSDADSNKSENDETDEDETNEETDEEENTDDEQMTEAKEKDSDEIANSNTTSYKEAAMTNQDDDATVQATNELQFMTRRAKITLKIEKPKSKEQRLKFLMQQASDTLKAARSIEKNVFLRDFSETERVDINEKSKWLKKFKSSDRSANNFVTFFSQGLYSWFPLNKTDFHFRAQLVLPNTVNVKNFLNDLEHVLPNGASVKDTLSQLIWSPTKIGNLLRSNEKMSSSSDFLDELNRRAHQINPKVHFGMNYGNINHPNGNSKDYRDGTRAVALETNKDTIREATAIAFLLFPSRRVKGHISIFGMNLVFFYDTKHEECANLPSVQVNIATLIKRQSIHHDQEVRVAHNHFIPGTLDDPVYSDSPKTLREVIMSIQSKTTPGSEGLKLFSSICYSEWLGKRSYWFHFHKCVKTEAESVVRALPIMLKCEYAVIPEAYFLETAMDGDESWDADTRQLENSVTIAMAAAVEGCADLEGPDNSDSDDEIQILETDHVSLNTIEEREKQRLMGGDDDETITDQKKRKAIKKQKSAQPQQRIVETIDIGDDTSIGESTVGMASLGSVRSSNRNKGQTAVLKETGKMLNAAEEKLKLQLDAERAENEKRIQMFQKRMEEMEDRFNNRLGLATPTKPPDIRVPVTIDKGHSQDHSTVQQQPMEADADSITSSQHDRWALNEAQIETENYLSDEERKRKEDEQRRSDDLRLAQDGIKYTTGKKKSTDESSVDSQSDSSPSEDSSSSSDEEENSDQDAHDEHEYASDDASRDPLSGDDELVVDQDHSQGIIETSNPYSSLHYSDSQGEESNGADDTSHQSETSLARSVRISAAESNQNQLDPGSPSNTDIKKNLDSNFSRHDHPSTGNMPGKDN